MNQRLIDKFLCSSSLQAAAVKEELVVVGVEGVGELVRGQEVLPELFVQLPDRVGSLGSRKGQGQNQKKL